MMIDKAPWEYYHHCSHLLNCKEDSSSDLNHPSVFYFLSNTVNTVDYEDSSFTDSTSLKNETTPFPNRVFYYDLVKSKSSLSKISKVNIHSNHHVECNEAWGHAPQFSLLCWGNANLS